MTTDSPFATYHRQCVERLERALEARLPPAEQAPERLHAAMRYAALGNGKRVRPLLVYATGRALGVAPEDLDGAACAIELIHAYSLVHDDLPAMDDDALRRGRPTCHKAYDEATAILVGDALQSEAFRILGSDPGLGDDPARQLRAVVLLAQAAGSRGMAGGQALDMAATGQDIDLPALELLHIHKTGALIRACAQLACLAAPAAAPAQVAALDHYAKCLGLAFQVRDDILDIEGATAVIGKTGGKDARSDKATYPALLGLQEAKARAGDLISEALRSLEGFDAAAEPLRDLAGFVIDRGS